MTFTSQHIASRITSHTRPSNINTSVEPKMVQFGRINTDTHTHTQVNVRKWMFSVCVGQPSIPFRKKSFSCLWHTAFNCRMLPFRFETMKENDRWGLVRDTLPMKTQHERNGRRSKRTHGSERKKKHEATIKKAETKQSSIASLSRRPCRHWKHQQANSNVWKHFLNRSAGCGLPATT